MSFPWRAVSASRTVATVDRRQYSVTCETEVSDRQLGPIAVSAGLPGLNTPYGTGAIFPAGFTDSDPDAVVVGYSGPTLRTETKSGILWNADVLYSTQTQERCQTDLAISPVNLPPIIRGGGTREQKFVIEDITGTKITNAAGDPFDNLFVDFSRQELEIEQNQATIDYAQLQDFTNRVNSATFFGLPAGSWKMDAPRWSRQFQGSCVPYYVVTYRFISDENLWGLEPANRGYRCLDADGDGVPAGKFTDFTTGDADGTVVAPGHPLPLDAKGKQLASGADTIYYDGTNAGLLPKSGPYFVYEQRDFSLLGIPTDF